MLYIFIDITVDCTDTGIDKCQGNSDDTGNYTVFTENNESDKTADIVKEYCKVLPRK